MTRPAAKRLAGAACTLLAAVALSACEPPGPLAPPARHFGLDGCDIYFPRTQQLADVDAAGVPIVCEQRPAWAPPTATGMFDGTIHVWLMDGPFMLKILGHEFGHYESARHPEWRAQWAALRSISDDRSAEEDLAESWAFCNYPHPVDRWEFAPDYPSDSTPDRYPTAQQCGVMHSWYAAR